MQVLDSSLNVIMSVQGKVLASLGVIMLLWLVRRLLLRVAFQRIEDAAIRYQWRKTSATFMFFVGFLVIGRIWFEFIGSLATFFGLLSAGLAIALKEPLSNIAGWIFIVWRKPFDVGNRIQIGGVAGDVIDLRIFQFTVMEIGNWVDADQNTGRIIHVPNSKVFTEPQANYSQGFEYIWNEIPVLITFESNWQKAKEILRRIAEKYGLPASKEAAEQVSLLAQKYLIFYTEYTPTVYTSVKDCGVMLTIRHMCEPRKRRGVNQEMWEEILEEFARCDDIDFAYPTTRWYDNRQEGKANLKSIGEQDNVMK